MMARPKKGHALDPAAVVEVAAEVFATRGYAGTTLDEVARRIGVTRQAILHHFSTKQDLFRGVLEAERAWAIRASLRFEEGTDVTDPFSPLAQFLGLDDHGRQRIRLQHVLQGEAIAGDPVAQEFIGLRTKVILEQTRGRVRVVADAGRLARGWTVESATTALVGLVNGLQAINLVDPGTDVRGAFDDFTAALLSPEGER
ncbi:TetR/AcrR family transcriptional regulator [Microbacterium sp. GXF7504]